MGLLNYYLLALSLVNLLLLVHWDAVLNNLWLLLLLKHHWLLHRHVHVVVVTFSVEQANLLLLLVDVCVASLLILIILVHIILSFLIT